MNFVKRHLGGLDQQPSGLAKLLAERPTLFVSLQDVLEKIAEANLGSFQDAAHLVLSFLGSEADFPEWRRTDVGKGAGAPYPQLGPEWGRKLLQHAAGNGQPVQYPHPAYDDYQFHTRTPPQGSIYDFLVHGPTLGFRLDQIGPFLARRGVAGFELTSGIDPELVAPTRDDESHEAALSENDRAHPPMTSGLQGIAGIRTTALAVAFEGLYWDHEGWKANLGKTPKWLKGCVVSPGAQGRAETLWNPVLVGAMLVAKKHVPAHRVRARFQSDRNLKANWLVLWREFEAENLTDG